MFSAVKAVIQYSTVFVTFHYVLFDFSLCKIVKHVGNPADCISSERCTLAYLFELFTTSADVKVGEIPCSISSLSVDRSRCDFKKLHCLHVCSNRFTVT